MTGEIGVDGEVARLDYFGGRDSLSVIVRDGDGFRVLEEHGSGPYRVATVEPLVEVDDDAAVLVRINLRQPTVTGPSSP